MKQKLSHFLIFMVIIMVGVNGLHPVQSSGIEKQINVGGRKLDCRVFGKGKPVVVLISGYGAPQTYWDSIVPGIAKHMTVVTYDRAGYGKSELGQRPVDGIETAKDLKNLLEKLKLSGPYLVVGHSYGGKITRLFASLYPKHIYGIVLVDSTHEDWVEDFRAIMNENERNKFDQLRAALSQQTSTPKTGPGKEGFVLDTTISQLRNISIRLEVPMVVITAGKKFESKFHKNLSKETYDRYRKLVLEHPKKHFKLSTKSKQIIVKDAGHNIHRDKPGIVIEIILEMVRNTTK